MIKEILVSMIPTKTEFEYGTITGVCYTFIVHYLGGYDDLLDVLLTLMVVDYITGVFKAWKNKDIIPSSKKGFRGIGKKFCIILVICLAYQIDRLEHVLLGIEGTYIRTLFLGYYISNEGLSILENIMQSGVPIPKFLPEQLHKTMEKISEEKAERKDRK